MRRHYVPADAARLSLSGRDHGLGEPKGARLAVVEYDGRGVLRQEALALWQARDLQHGSGRQFTSADFTDMLRDAEVRISMDGRSRWMDSVFLRSGFGGR